MWVEFVSGSYSFSKAFFEFNLETDYKESFHGHHCELMFINMICYLHVLIVTGGYSWTMPMWHCCITPLLGISKCLSIATTDTQGWTLDGNRTA